MKKAPLQTGDRELQLFQSLSTAKEDLSQAHYFAKFLIKKNWHYEPWERRWTTYMQQSAFTTALVISYSRPFTKCRAWPAFPTRLLKHNAQEKALHLRILKLRDIVYAHSDVGIRNIRPIHVKYSDYPSRLTTEPPMRLTREQTEMLIHMIQTTSASIHTRLKEIHAKLAIPLLDLE